VVDSFHIMPDAYSSSLLDSMIASFVFTSWKSSRLSLDRHTLLKWLNVTVTEKQCRFLLDTGATVNLLDQNTHDRIGAPKLTREKNPNFEMVFLLCLSATGRILSSVHLYIYISTRFISEKIAYVSIWTCGTLMIKTLVLRGLKRVILKFHCLEVNLPIQQNFRNFCICFYP
jgi:hypothetical protein